MGALSPFLETSRVASSRGRLHLCFSAIFRAFLTIILIYFLSIHILNTPTITKSIINNNHGAPTGSNTLGAVATESSVCTKIGIDILRNGGNAADAIVASTFCVGVIGMYHSGIGGGGFMLVRAPNGSYESIDFRETAPAMAFRDMYENNSQGSVVGGLAAGVPGEIRGLQYLHENYGSLPWELLVQPAVEVARSGFRVTEDLDRCMRAAILDSVDQRDFLTLDPTWAVDFAPNGTRLGVGDTIYRQRYADTLEAIGRDGPDTFYTGSTAAATVQAIQNTNGTTTARDFKDYAVIKRQVSHISYRGYNLYSTTAPSSGGVALSTLKTIEGYSTFMSPESINISTHRMVEGIRFAFAQRARLGDPNFVPSTDLRQEEMWNEATAAKNRAKISDHHTLNVSEYDPDESQSIQNHGTAYLAAADNTGLAISLTTTINLLFGSQVMVPETGIIRNDVMNDLSIPGINNQYGYSPSPANYIRPGKRALLSTTPVIVENMDGTLNTVIGAAGGLKIITATVQSLVHLLDQNMTLETALRQPRLHDQLIPNELRYEIGYAGDVIEFLKSRGHNISFMPSTMSAVQGVRWLSNGSFEAASEPRQINSAGYVI